MIQSSITKRALMVSLLAGSGILAASAYAVSGDSAEHGCEKHGQKTQVERTEQRAKHMSELKQKLHLTSSQAAAWDAFANASQPGMQGMGMGMGKMGVDKDAMRNEFAKMSTPQRIDKMMAMSDMRHTQMMQRADATKAFYAQLTPEQQKIFDAEAMPKGGHWGPGQHHHQS